jgi:hypothetical protein
MSKTKHSKKERQPTKKQRIKQSAKNAAAAKMKKATSKKASSSASDLHPAGVRFGPGLQRSLVRHFKWEVADNFAARSTRLPL